MEQDNLFEKAIPVDIEREVRKSFLEYSMSVIVSRAIPDVRDGLKPVHRRILYAMHDQGMTHEKAHKKSATIVGEVMGKYHPHGDAAIYDTMVKMAQEFSLRYPMIDGHGNFGSIDGDSAAAMRYTESRMSRIAGEMLKDIDKETVEWRPNYDDSREEPWVLPARVPNLLINGTAGIAVGMATNIPPHNLGEVADALKILLKDPEASLDELMTVLPGPDFPTAGILNANGVRKAYETGRATVRIRSRYEIEELKGGKNAIIIKEIPYQVNKSRLVERIAELAREKKIDGITDLRDESDRRGIRVVIELRRDVSPLVVVNNLYKHTPMEDTFGINMLALVNGEPKTLSLKQILENYISHRQLVITRRSRYELRLAEERKHIVEGLLIALDHLDAVIETIRSSQTVEIARNRLIESFSLSERQAQAILDMRLARLTGMERGKLDEEFNNLLLTIADLEDILARPERVLQIIDADLDEVKKLYGDPRRTEIRYDETTIEFEDMIEDKDAVITLSHIGYIKRQPLDNFGTQNRGGVGISVGSIKEEDIAFHMIVCTLLSHVLLFTNQGRVFSMKAYQIPEYGRSAKGLPLINLVELRPGESISTIVPIKEFDPDKNLMMVTRLGTVKKTPLNCFAGIRRNGLIAINLVEGDELIGVIRVRDDTRAMLVSMTGKAIMFDSAEVRSMGRMATGVRGIRLKEGDRVIGVDKYRENADAFIVTEHGYGKRVSLEEFRGQKRGGMGVKTINMNKRNGAIVDFQIVTHDEELMILTEEGKIIRLDTNKISQQKRESSGVKLMNVAEGDRVAVTARFKPERDD